MTLNNTSETEGNLDQFARYLFFFLIFFSLVNDSFNIYHNVIENKIIKENINYFKDLSEAFVGILSNKEKKIKNGIIIKNKDNNEDKKESKKGDNVVEKEENKEKKRNIIKKNIFRNTLMDEITK